MILKRFIAVTSPHAKGQRDYQDVDNIRDGSFLSRDGQQDYGEYDDEYYEDYDYITKPDTFGTYNLTIKCKSL